MTRSTAAQLGSQNRCAFLDCIAHSEIQDVIFAESDDGYNVLVGSTPARPLLFNSYADHPNILNKQLNSTAAGRYQLLHRYYLAYKESMKLFNFSPESQDAIAIQQIRESGALDDIDAGNFSVAIQKCSHLWASLPGSQYGQHTNDLSSLKAEYIRAGGTLNIGQ